MTAEIAVMNRQGVALAADSAVTFEGTRGPKIFSSADKIFTLSKYEPVGVMVYGTAALNNVPWETVVKLYRAQLGEATFPTVKEYADDFLRFVATDAILINEERKRGFMASETARFFGHVRARMIEAVEEAAGASGPIPEREARRVALKVINDHHKRYGALDDRSDMPTGLADPIQHDYGGEIAAAKKAIFEDFPLPKRASERLDELAAFLMTKAGMGGDSGVVFAGFGTENVFPQLVACELDGVIFDHVVLRARSTLSIDDDGRALVHGFAQSDVIQMFMEGVTGEYEQFVEGYVSRVIEQYGDVVINQLGAAGGAGLKDALRQAESHMMDGLRTEFYGRRRDLYVDPILDVVASLPKDELGAMAESLVTLTSLKRRISMEHETVGGPVDVAVITKGDGLVWTKRKHYFEPALNHHFFANYFRSAADGQA